MPDSHSRNAAVRVVRVPRGLPDPDDFEVGELPVPSPDRGEMLVRGMYLAIDPSARRRLPVEPGSVPPLGAVADLGDVVLAGVVPPTSGLDGALVGEVVESRHPDFQPGDFVRGGSSWQRFHVMDGAVTDRVEPVTGFPLSLHLGVLGRPGFVGYCGMTLIGDVKPGETVVVSAAGGAVGMVAGQLATLAGARVVGIASGDKARYVVEDLGFDACVDRHEGDVGDALGRLCPDGIDVYFDNVGGAVLDDVFARLNTFGRVVVCGMASEYNEAEATTGPPLRPVLRKRLRIQGFVVYDHYEQFPAYEDWAVERVRDGRLKYREDVIDGLENAPTALAGVLQGHNKGRQLVKIGPDPTQV